MRRDDAEEYTQALGQVVAGGWRQIALGEKLGVPNALGLSTRDWVEQRLGGYIKLSIAERHGAVSELITDGRTQQQIADVLGVSQPTVSNDVSKLIKPPVEPVDAVAGLTATNDVREAHERREASCER